MMIARDAAVLVVAVQHQLFVVKNGNTTHKRLILLIRFLGAAPF